MASQSVLSGGLRHIKVHFRDIQFHEIIPERTILLESPTFEVRIGRGSQTEAFLHPQKSNAWFTSRVMSREHAILRADIETKKLYLEDTRSMHGTYINGTRLVSDRPTEVRHDDKIRFGTDIVRGDQTYKPLEIRLDVDWDIRSAISPAKAGSKLSLMAQNSFSIDYSDEEDNDDDIEFISESIRVPSNGASRQVKTFMVPDFEDSEDSDIDKHGEEESAPSSPAELEDVTPQKTAPLASLEITSDPSDVLKEDFTHRSPDAAPSVAMDLSDEEDEDYDPERNAELDSFSIDSEEDHDLSDADANYDNDNGDGSHHFDLEDGPDDEEEQAFNSIHQGSSITQAQITIETHPRDPSPSDAAMPKPSWLQPGILPSIQPSPPSSLAHAPSPFSAFNGSFGTPSHSSMMPPYGYYTGMNWTGEGHNSYPMTFDHSHQAPNLFNNAQYSPYRQWKDTCQAKVGGNTEKTALSATIAEDENSVKPSKVSINDIVDGVRLEAGTTCSSRKRKVDEISNITTTSEEQIIYFGTHPEDTEAAYNKTHSDNLLKLPTSSDETAAAVNESTLTSDTIPEKTTPCKKTVTFSPDAVIIEPDSERARKRVKIQPDDQGNNLFKYFAATVAGVTIGAVGTIFGLAALPADYFV